MKRIGSFKTEVHTVIYQYEDEYDDYVSHAFELQDKGYVPIKKTRDEQEGVTEIVYKKEIEIN